MPGPPPGSSSPTTQHAGADGSREYRISDPRSLLRLSFPGSTDPSPRRSPPLPEELVEEVLLRFPPDDPARLVRAALACRRWRRLICGPRFRRRFREFHRAAPPMLGFFVNNLGATSSFVRTSATSPPVGIDLPAIDARHGRVLLHRKPWSVKPHALEHPFFVWDPITDERRELPLLLAAKIIRRRYFWSAAVLCAASLGGACDHLDCHRGPLLVVLVCHKNKEVLAYVYSSEAGAWSGPTSSQQFFYCEDPMQSALVGNALYFFKCNKKSKLRPPYNNL